MSRILFVILLLILPLKVFPQPGKLLILDKAGSKKRITYTIGDDIVLKNTKDRFEIKELIVDIRDSVIVFNDYFVHVNDIEYVKTFHTEGFLSPSNGPKLIIAGVLLFGIDQLNNSVIQGNEARLHKGVTITSASLVVFGAFWTSLRVRKFRPGRNKRIRTFVI